MEYNPDRVDQFIDSLASSDADLRRRTAMERTDKKSAGIKRSETMKNRWKNAEYIDRVKQGKANTKEKSAEITKNLWANQKFREKQLISRSRPCETPLGKFSSLEDATKAHGKKPCNRWIRRQIANQVPGFRYL